MDCGDLLPVVLDCEVEGKSSDALSLGDCADLQALHYARIRLVLESRVLALGVLTDDGEIDIGVAGREARERFAVNDGGVDIERLTHRYVPTVVRICLKGGVENTLEPDLVALDRLDRLEELRLAGVRLTAHVILGPLHGGVERLEDLLDGLSELTSDTVTRDEGDVVDAAESAWFTRGSRCGAGSVSTSELGGLDGVLVGRAHTLSWLAIRLCCVTF